MVGEVVGTTVGGGAVDGIMVGGVVLIMVGTTVGVGAVDGIMVGVGTTAGVGTMVGDGTMDGAEIGITEMIFLAATSQYRNHGKVLAEIHHLMV